MELNKIYNEDCLQTMKRMPDNFVDSIVTDPPYGISFMGKEWDSFDPKYQKVQMERESKRRPRTDGRKATGFQESVYAGLYDLTPKGMVRFQAWYCEIMQECLRVLKPGGHVLSFGSPRTYHRMACAIEDAGFEIRDQMQWIFGSGFPKSLNIGKAVDELLGNERESLGVISKHHIGGVNANEGWNRPSHFEADGITPKRTMEITKGTSEWEGWGTGLKPANEPICLARKPLSEKTVTLNVLKWGTGGINIDGCRIETEDSLNGGAYSGGERPTQFFNGGLYRKEKDEFNQPQGRFPANVIHDGSDEVLQGFPDSTSGEMDSMSQGKNYGIYGKYNGKHVTSRASSGSAARFFYVPKADSKERQEGCYELEKKPSGMISNTSGQHITRRDGGAPQPKGNNHPTVKPIKLIQYLQRLVTPKGGLTYDPFGGSGTSAISASNEGFKWILSEIVAEYCDIANKRIYNNNGLFI